MITGCDIAYTKFMDDGENTSNALIHDHTTNKKYKLWGHSVAIYLAGLCVVDGLDVTEGFANGLKREPTPRID